MFRYPSARRVVFGPPPLIQTLVEDLIAAAIEAAKRPPPPPVRPDVRRRHAPTLRPGPDTPLWNQLVRNVRPHLRRRGSKAQLARLLGLPRQRLQDTLKAGTASLDAERTLLLIGWLGFFLRGGQLVPAVRPGPKTAADKSPAHPGLL
jgi:hypothetical protein